MSNNYLIAINKPINWTSSDVVVKVRNVLSKALGQKIKIGHMGTLDPIASGVLLLGINKATRLFDYLLSKDKEYIGTLTFGTSTDTLDSTGKVISTSKLPKVEDIKSSLSKFIGEISQIPPKYSALKINGQKAYDLARKGVEFEIAPRIVNIYNLRLIDYVDTNEGVLSANIDIKCSSGTYIRSLFYDIAQNLGVDGNMSALNRVKLANVGIEDAVDLEEFLNSPLDHFINPLDVLKNIFDVYDLNDEQYIKVSNGIGINIENKNEHLVFTYKNELKFIAKGNNGLYKSQANLE